MSKLKQDLNNQDPKYKWNDSFREWNKLERKKLRKMKGSVIPDTPCFLFNKTVCECVYKSVCTLQTIPINSKCRVVGDINSSSILGLAKLSDCNTMSLSYRFHHLTTTLACTRSATSWP